MNAKNDLILPVILAGGKGSRLWPMSRTARPKQFLSLTGDISLFQQTLLRLQDSAIYMAPLVITNSEYRFIVAEQALECDVELGAIVLEPVARNTAAFRGKRSTARASPSGLSKASRMVAVMASAARVAPSRLSRYLACVRCWRLHGWTPHALTLPSASSSSC